MCASSETELERAEILCEGRLISAQHLSLCAPRRPVQATTTTLSAVERETIDRVLRECGGNKSKAARRLGLSRTQLYVRLRKYDIDDLDRPAAERSPVPGENSIRPIRPVRAHADVRNRS